MKQPPSIRIHQSQIVWASHFDIKKKRVLLHAHYGNMRLTRAGKICGGERKPGNSLLCGERKGMHDGNDNFLPIEQVTGQPLDESLACKQCLNIFKILKP